MSSIMEKLLITGSGGLLGSRVCEIFQTATAKQLFRHYHHPPSIGLPPGGFAGDLGDPDHVKTLAETISPDIIINCAAMADVDRCELEPRLSERGNIDVVRHLLEAFPRAIFVQISTDYVFPESPVPPSPDTPTGPLNTYGRHKLAAEKAVQRHSDDNLIIRTNTMFDWTAKRNFFHFVYLSLESGRHINCFDDQYSNPLSSESAAVLIRKLLEKKAKGVYHIGGQEFVSRFELAGRIARCFALTADLISPISVKDMPRPAARPYRAGLDYRATELFLEIPMPKLEDDLDRLRNEIGG